MTESYIVMVPVIDRRLAPRATPASTSLAGPASALGTDMRWTRKAARAAPAKANQRKSLTSVSPSRDMERTTDSDAPALMPRMPGSARGLRVSPCMTTPATASEAPTMTARTVRGIRSCQTMTEATVVLPGTKAPATSSSVRLCDPTARLTRHRSTDSTPRTRTVPPTGTPTDVGADLPADSSPQPRRRSHHRAITPELPAATDERPPPRPHLSSG